jgi:hypothetical protein
MYRVVKTGPEIAEVGECAMRNGKSFLLITIVVLLLLVLLDSTLDGIALTHSGWMGNGWNQMMGTQQGYPRMMGTQPGYPGMMGGTQSTTPNRERQ